VNDVLSKKMIKKEVLLVLCDTFARFVEPLFHLKKICIFTFID